MRAEDDGGRSEGTNLESLVGRDELLIGLQPVQGVVEKRNTMPVLSSILFESKSEGFAKMGLIKSRVQNLQHKKSTSVSRFCGFHSRSKTKILGLT